MDAELHLKMSKKIAQLTKVIFHLNTKNEDAASELQATIQGHRRETEMLAKEAAAKMSQLKESLEKREAQLKSMDNIKKIKEKHQKEKQDAMSEFQRYKDEVRSIQQRREEQFQAEVDGMTTELRKTRNAFQERVTALKTALEALQTKTTNGQADVASIKLKHSEEVADMVTQSNKKYNDMLTAQLNQQDHLKAEFEIKVAALEKDHQRTLQQLQEKADNEAKLAIKRRELECNTSADSMKNEMVSKMERLLSEIETLRGSESQLMRDKEELQQELTALKSTMKQIKIELENEKRTAATLQQNADSALRDANSNLSERQNQLAILEEEVGRFRKLSETLDNERRSLQSDLEKLRSEQQSTTSSVSEREKQWNVTLKAVEIELNSTKQQLKDKVNEVQKLQTQMKSVETQHTKSDDELKSQLLSIQKKNKELQANLSVATANEAHLQQQLTTCNNDIKQLRVEKSEHEQTIANLKQLSESFQQSASKKEKDLHQKLDSLERECQELRAAQGKLIAEHEKSINELQESAQSVSQAQKAAMEKNIETLKSQLASAQRGLNESQDHANQLEDELSKAIVKQNELQNQIKQSDAASRKENQEREKQKSQFDSERDKLEKQLKKEKSLSEKLDGEVKALKLKIESAARSHASSLAELNKEHAREIETFQQTMAAKIQEAVAKAEATMQQHVNEQRDFLFKMHSTELSDLQEQIDTWRQKLKEQQVDHEKALLEQQEAGSAMCATIVADYTKELNTLEMNWDEKHRAYQLHMQTTLDETVAKHKNHMDAANSDHNLKINQMTSEAAIERDRLITTHATEKNQLNQTLKEELEFAERELNRKLAELRDKKDAEQQLAISNLTTAHNKRISQWEDQVEQYNRKISGHLLDIKGLEGEKVMLQKTIAERHAEGIQKELAWQRDKEQTIEALRKHHKVEVEQLVEVHLHETQNLSNQFEKTRQLLHEQQQQLIGKIREWEQVYARRDSRLEDLNRIADLEQEVGEKDALVQQTVEEMAYIKRELLNREETYNNTFSRSPNVGVLQVLKPTNLNTATPPPTKMRKTKPQGPLPINPARPLPPIGTTNQQGSFRDLGQS